MSEKGTPKSSSDELKALGVSAKNNRDLYSFDKPDRALLEKISLEAQGIIRAGNAKLIINIDCLEFNSLCPITKQPDQGEIYINYVPHKHLVESKSLKLYLMGYRNHPAFHEKCIEQICTDIFTTIDPDRISVHGKFKVRGGISINPSFTLFAGRTQISDDKDA